MTTYAYAQTYLDDAMNNLGYMLDYAVCDCGYDADDFFDLFISSGIAVEFGRGNPKYIAGMSGPELVKEVIYKLSLNSIDVPPSDNTDKSPEYWVGWALAYYQWYSGLDFKVICGCVSVSELLRLYPTLHEADISKFVEFVDRRLKNK